MFARNKRAVNNIVTNIVRCQQQYTLPEAIEILSRTRYSEYQYSSKPVSDALLRKLLELAQLAPSSFNLQPYKLIVVRTQEMKDALSTAMLGPNVNRVRTAAATVIFAADRDATRATRKLMKLELENGKHPAYVSSLPSKITMMLGNGWLSTRIRKLGTHIVSPLLPAPVIHTNQEAWAMKNTALVAQQLMMAATAYSLRTTPMEGFDERRVCYTMSIPEEEYTIPMVVSIGYSANEVVNNIDGKQVDINITSSNENESKNISSLESSENNIVKTIANIFPAKTRFPLEDICYSEKFGRKLDM